MKPMNFVVNISFSILLNQLSPGISLGDEGIQITKQKTKTI
jgi:hypothetical protein